MSSKVYIGIDPDVDYSGVATWHKNKLDLHNMSFFELFDFLKMTKEGAQYTGEKIIVRIEAGWLNKKSNWHNEKAGVGVAAKIGLSTGANHEAGRKIVEMCKYLGLEYDLCVPKSSKIKKEEFRKITGWASRSNQEQRDAAMLIYGF